MKFSLLPILLLVLGFSFNASAQGCIKGDCENGEGTYTWADGSKYNGQFKNNKQHGFGYFIWADGSRYDGEWFTGKLHGNGLFTWPTGKKVKGRWQMGQFIKGSDTVVAESEYDRPQGENADRTPPEIVIIEPTVKRGLTVVSAKRHIQIHGYAADDTGVKKVLVNGMSANLDSPNQVKTTFTSKLSLTDGENVFTIKAFDEAGNYSTAKFAVKYNTTGSMVDNNDGPFADPDENDTQANETESPKVVPRTPTVRHANAGKRTALVIGNGNYKFASLRNAVNDADSIALELNKIGWEVLHYADLNQQEMETVINEYSRKLKSKGGAGMFYFAGHGLQVEGSNYLVPVGTSIRSEDEIQSKAVNLGILLEEITYASNDFNIVILDACRDNPFAGSSNFRTANRTGLAPLYRAPVGTFIAYSTAPGSAASDGNGNNGLYTQEFLKAIRTPNLKIEDVFKKVRTNVRKQSEGMQIPWENSSIEGDFYFNKQKK